MPQICPSCKSTCTATPGAICYDCGNLLTSETHSLCPVCHTPTGMFPCIHCYYPTKPSDEVEDIWKAFERVLSKFDHNWYFDKEVKMDPKTQTALKELRTWCEVHNAEFSVSEEHVNRVKLVFWESGDIFFFGTFEASRHNVIAENYESF